MVVRGNEMGNYFVMSTRFDKSKASDFGLISKSADIAINPIDRSTWRKAALYDFGWGKENGFYKEPLPDFDLLLDLALYSTDYEDMYGSAAIILEKFPDNLLYKCELFMQDCFHKKEFQKMVKLFDLKCPTNRCSVLGKTYEQIENDYKRWLTISTAAIKL